MMIKNEEYKLGKEKFTYYSIFGHEAHFELLSQPVSHLNTFITVIMIQKLTCLKLLYFEPSLISLSRSSPPPYTLFLNNDLWTIQPVLPADASQQSMSVPFRNSTGNICFKVLRECKSKLIRSKSLQTIPLELAGQINNTSRFLSCLQTTEIRN